MKVENFLTKNDNFILLTGNLTKYIMKNNRDKNVLIDLINNLISFIGDDKTLAIQTFNWDFCYGKTYDILNSKSQTGILGNFALKNSNFKRTKHPIYSFAVAGKYKEKLVNINNKGAFDNNSVFNFMYKNNGVMIIFDLPLQDSFTFVHFVEENLKVDYRYNKSFKSTYIDENGISDIREYSMYVRKDCVITDINSLENIFVKNEIMDIINYDGIIIKKIDLKRAYELIAMDIIENNGNNLHRIN
ncbi:AAC(3) family N-acetyltransferase [Campylobacter volucris]|uniref:AAC(3) family N-acetyltransferase n=1 Tax=Campylobacter volucris TaxID=1031542 RepID=UPI00189D2113|nr:AAC(3) family N-acetyltransferase [Campylobacter volucris]MBF7066749.1 AAC(3) family N-acetyltransferase [Campylobacter volucris]